MRAKRSKSEERRKKMLYRQKRTREKIAEDLQKDRERKRALSNKGDDGDIKKYFDEREENRKRMEKIRSNLSHQETAIEKKRLRERMAKLRLKKSSEEKALEKEKLRDRVAKLRFKQSPEEREYDMIRKKQRARETRKGWNPEEHWLAKQEAKKGMRLLREEGRIRAYSDRGSNKRTTRKDDLSEWDAFINKSKEHKDLLMKRDSDIVRRLNEKRRKKVEENERKKQVEEEKERERYEIGEWIYNPANDDYWWSGKGEPVYYNDDNVGELTEEEWKQIEKQQEMRLEADMKEARERRNMANKVKRKALKEALKKPIPALPVRELSEYEKLRENNIKERYEAMKKIKFFEELEEAKINMVVKNDE